MKLGLGTSIFAIALTTLCVANELPKVLIVQQPRPKKADEAVDLSLANYLAQQIYDEGLGDSIVYGTSDPEFRAAQASGKLSHPPSRPTFLEALAVAKSLGATYVVTYSGTSVKNGLAKSKCTLYQEGRKVWENTADLGVKSGASFDSAGTLNSMARTWVLQMRQGPLKSIKEVKPVQPVAPLPGQEPRIPNAPTEALPSAAKLSDDTGSIRAQVNRMILAGDFDHAIPLLRDAVDRAPFDVLRRVMLVQTLLDANMNKEAGLEADRATKLFANSAELRSLAAKAWLAAGKADEAQNALNEAIARNPKSSATLMLLAELSLSHQEPDKALDYLDKAIEGTPSSGAHFLRALCRALLGGADGVKLDLSASDKVGPIEAVDQQRQYELAATVLDDSVKALGNDVKEILRLTAAKSDVATVRDRAANAIRLMQAHVTFLSLVNVPSGFRGSNDRRLLAHKLLTQALDDILLALNGSGEDSLTDATINLGEAIKQAAVARNTFADEKRALLTGGSGSSN